METLPPSFFFVDGISLAKNLLGQILVHETPQGRISGRICETEAYMGISDAASHAFGGRRTARTESMYLPGGHAYVYLIYGMHCCMNVVANAKDIPEAVLIRALEPIDGIPLMQKNRHLLPLQQLLNGPGKLCQGLSISKAQNGVSLCQGPLFLSPGESPRTIGAAKRIHIDYAGPAKDYLWRFYIKDSPFLSKKP